VQMADLTHAPKTSRELRKFGITMAVAFGLFAALFWWRDKSYWNIVAWIAAGFFVPALAFPTLLRPIEWTWMKIAGFLGAIMTRVLLTLTFYLVVTPLGWLMRLMGKDSLLLKRQQHRSSFWIAVEPDGPCSRPEKPF